MEPHSVCVQVSCGARASWFRLVLMYVWGTFAVFLLHYGGALYCTAVLGKVCPGASRLGAPGGGADVLDRHPTTNCTGCCLGPGSRGKQYCSSTVMFFGFKKGKT